MALIPENKNSVTMNPMYKAGSGWQYDDPGITYDGEFDAEGRPVLYDSIGSVFVLTPDSKNSVSLSGLSKNSI